MRKICKIFWPQKISNVELLNKTNCRKISTEIKERRLKWLGHVFRMEQQRHPKVALRWTPPGKRRPGRPKTTWRRTVAAELQDGGMTWGEAQKLAKDRPKWRQKVAALCLIGDEED